MAESSELLQEIANVYPNPVASPGFFSGAGGEGPKGTEMGAEALPEDINLVTGRRNMIIILIIILFATIAL